MNSLRKEIFIYDRATSKGEEAEGEEAELEANRLQLAPRKPKPERARNKSMANGL